jgi:hypothetical protein
VSALFGQPGKPRSIGIGERDGPLELAAKDAIFGFGVPVLIKKLLISDPEDLCDQQQHPTHDGNDTRHYFSVKRFGQSNNISTQRQARSATRDSL